MPSMAKEDMVERLADLEREHPSIELVILFGSTTRGRARSESDLDIAVRGDEFVDLDALYVVLAPRLRSERLDLVDLRTAGSVLAFEVARHGQPLYERDAGTFRSFQALASRRYCDMAKLRRAQQRTIRAFLERQGLA
jgi:predicted nucleotidyltransferase